MQSRRPAGTPVGGQFAPTYRPEATGIDLVDDDCFEPGDDGPARELRPTTSPHAKASVPGGPFYHATSARLRKGGEVVPAREVGVRSRWRRSPGYSDHLVYIADESYGMMRLSGFGDHLYEVEPLDDVLPDPEMAAWEAEHPGSSNPSAGSWVTTWARVVRRVY